MVIFVFLRNVWATVIPSLALPFSIIGTFAVMYMLGYSLDNLSMMALILSVGFVVDDAIVMLENIYRHVEMGEDPLTASLVGSREIGFTIVSMTLSLAAVFIPVLFMGGVLGPAVPRVLGHHLRRHPDLRRRVGDADADAVQPLPEEADQARRRPSKFGRVTEQGFDSMLRGYDRTLQIVLRHRPATMAAFVVVLVLTGVLFVIVPKGFIPEQDTDQIAVTTEAAQGTSYDKLVEYQDEVADIIRADPNVEGLVSTIGGSAAATLGGPNLGQIVVHLKPRGERKELATDIIERLRPELAKVPGMEVYMQNPPTIRIGGQVSKSLYQYSMQSPNREELYAGVARAEEGADRAARHRGPDERPRDHEPAGQRRDRPRQGGGARRHREPDRERVLRRLRPALGLDDLRAGQRIQGAARAGAAVPDRSGGAVAALLQGDAAAGRRAGRQRSGTLSTATTATGANAAASGAGGALGAGGANSTRGLVVPLDTLAHATQVVGPQTVNHHGQLPAVTISFGLAPGASLGDVLTRVAEVADQTLPETVSGAFQGAAKAFESSLGNLAVLLVIAIMVVYIVLGILYESYIHPLTILSGLPSAAFGALVTLIIFRMDLNIYAFVGMIMLIGIVEKNAIMQIDFALEAERGGMTPEEAIYEGCLIRFRPIMMTTMAALLGAVPIAVGYGAGGEARQPLGLVVVGGLLFSQLVTLYLTPVVYTYMAQLQSWMKSRQNARTLTPVTAGK